jgi:transposase
MIACPHRPCRKLTTPSHHLLTAVILAEVRRLDQRITAATKAIGEAVTASGTTLTEVFGLGPVPAAKILGQAGDLTRFPDRDHFASYTGTAPIEASSGDVRRHRLNRGGNRQLNTALHLIAVCQIRDPSPGQAYYQRKLRQAKTPEEARRALKRKLSNVVYRHLVADHRRHQIPPSRHTEGLSGSAFTLQRARRLGIAT